MIDDATTDAKQFSQITFSAGDPAPGPVAAFICLSLTATAQVIFSRGAKRGSTKVSVRLVVP
jgi:hypothetical protein